MQYLLGVALLIVGGWVFFHIAVFLFKSIIGVMVFVLIASVVGFTMLFGDNKD